MRNMSININVLAFSRAKNLYNGLEYNELYDALYHYMLTYLNGPEIDNYMFLDEVENYIGTRNHNAIVDYILTLK